jgi:hypothetical protein
MVSQAFFQPAAGIPPFQPIAGGTFSMGPELVTWGPSDQFLYALAVGTDQALWYATLDGFTTDVDTPAIWSSWQSLGGVVMSAPSAVRSGESSVDVFAVGAESELLHWKSRDGVWDTHGPVVKPERAARIEPGFPPPVYTRHWESLGGILTSPPHAVVFGELGDEILVFARGMDQALWNRPFVAGAWRDWTSLGHILASPPHAVVAAKETLAVFALGIDSAVWYTMGAEWQSLGGTFSSRPYAISERGDILVFAADANSALSWRRWHAGSWTDWESLGGILMTPPIADCPPDGLPYVFTLGTDSGVWCGRPVADNQTWFDWESLGIGLLSLPATVAREPDVLFQFRALAGLGPDHQVWFQEDDF